VPCPILLASGFFIREFGMSKEPELSFFQQLLAFATLAGLGGVVNYLTTLKTGKKFKWSSFFIELVCSAFVGVIFGLFFVATDMPIIMSLAGAGVSGHLGTRSLMMLHSKYNLSE
ncbi:MAG TPA: phage holin family protein, partial [Agitococcus sp.]|nr:phage holin family protein [Agitococcus sp.]